jgi:endonuclease YncB( thermonuclease family)
MKNVYIILGLATILTIAQLLFGPAVAKEVEMKVYNYEITRVIDGDTVAFRADFLPDPLKQD